MKKKIRNYIVFVLAIVLTSSVVIAGTYTVEEGDLLWKIAKDKDVILEELIEANDLSNPNKIFAGDTLIIPDKNDVAIGDGLGSAQRELAELYLAQKSGNKDMHLAMNTLDEAGINSTYCADTLITDSAAAGTALASGVKTNKGVIGQDANGNDIKTLVEEAIDAGIATGLVSSTRLTHATPAVFAAHNESRNNESAIADDF